MTDKSYRPHNPGHDYYGRGVYLITLVVTERQRTLSVLGNDARNPDVALLPAGAIVKEEWEKTEAIQNERGRKIQTLVQVCMPDHWHGVIVVDEPMDKSLGFIIQSFKSACTARWRREVTGYVEPASSSALIRSASTKKRRAYYATRPLIERPLFDDDYDDTICLSDDHMQRMIHYVQDNPRRAIIRRLLPQFMQRRMHVIIDGTDYAAFGNLFLLRWARKEQVFCHRKARFSQLSLQERQRYGYTYTAANDMITSIPYEQTEAYGKECEEWERKIIEGATVIVTPGISKGERLMKERCLKQGFPLIHLQKEPINEYWKPELSRFEACINGSLLILAPWSIDSMGTVNGIPSATDYSRFHNLNALAQAICSFDGNARIVR